MSSDTRGTALACLGGGFLGAVFLMLMLTLINSFFIRDDTVYITDMIQNNVIGNLTSISQQLAQLSASIARLNSTT